MGSSNTKDSKVYKYSSLPGGRPEPNAVIVCVDVPDPDNFLMVLRVIKDYEHCKNMHVNVVISPRPVSFAAIPYGPMLATLSGKCAEMGINKSKVFGRITDDDLNSWVQEFNDDDKKWLYMDEGFEDPAVREDTALYIEISRIRLIKFLHAHGIPPERYSLYTDRNYENCNIVPGTHHALHRPDFAFDFGGMLVEEDSLPTDVLSSDRSARFEEMRRKAKAAKVAAKEAARRATPNKSLPQGPAIYSIDLFQAAVTNVPDNAKSQHSQQRREDTRSLCDIYIYLETHKRNTPCKFQNYGTINDLTQKFKEDSVLKPLVYVGGPFTETLKIIEGLGPKKIGPVIAMAGATHGQSNIFSNQFNILIDPAAAKAVLDLAAVEKIDLTLLPTECAKGSAYDLEWDVFKKDFGSKFKSLDNLYSQWSPNRPVTLFDLLAAMTVTSELYKDMLYSVKFNETPDNKFQFTRGKEKETSSGLGLKMFWNEPSGKDGDGKDTFNQNSVMLKRQKYFFKELEWTFSEYGTTRKPEEFELFEEGTPQSPKPSKLPKLRKWFQ